MKTIVPVLVMLLSLNPLSVEAQDAGASDAAAPSVDPAIEEARRAQVLARVNDVTITLGQVEDAINQQSPFMRMRYRDPQRLLAFAQDMVRFELLAAAALSAGMAEAPIVRKTIRQNAVQQLIRTQIDERITQADVAEIDIQTYYETHPDEFNQPEMRRASHILFADLPSAQAALEEAREADARGFREMARRLSIDNDTKLRGGDLRYFNREGAPPGAAGRAGPANSGLTAPDTTSGDEETPRQVDPSVDARLVEAAFALENLGDVVSEPVAVEGGSFSIVKLTGLRAPEVRTLEMASQAIRLRLWRERRQEALDSLVQGIRERVPPTVHLERMRPIHLEPLGPAERFRNHGHSHGDEGAHGHTHGDEHGHGHGAQRPQAAEDRAQAGTMTAMEGR